MAPRKFPLNPGHPERICWGCEHYCPAHDLRCGNGSVRTQHPREIFGPDWLEVGLGTEQTGGVDAAGRALVYKE